MKKVSIMVVSSITSGLLILTAACAPAAPTSQPTITRTPATTPARAPVITPAPPPVITPSTATVRPPVITPSTTPVPAPVITPGGLITITTPSPTPTPPAPAPTPQLQWLGQSTFVLTSANGTKILIDPVGAGVGFTITQFFGMDAVTVSHEHGDHNNVGMAAGSPLILRGLTGTGANQTWATVNQTVKGIRIYSISPAVPIYHDNVSGAQRGRNAIFVYEVDGLRIVHLGDLGHTLNASAINAIGRVDVLMIPVGGFYTIDAAAATTVVGQLSPKIVIPMHYKTPRHSATWPGVGVDAFLVGKIVTRVQSTVIKFSAATLPAQTTVMLPFYEE